MRTGREMKFEEWSVERLVVSGQFSVVSGQLIVGRVQWVGGSGYGEIGKEKKQPFGCFGR